MALSVAVLLAEAGFVLTGVIQTLGNQQVFLNGAGGGGLSGLTLLAQYSGNSD
jgi:hypothetical protein